MSPRPFQVVAGNYLISGTLKDMTPELEESIASILANALVADILREQRTTAARALTATYSKGPLGLAQP